MRKNILIPVVILVSIFIIVNPYISAYESYKVDEEPEEEINLHSSSTFHKNLYDDSFSNILCSISLIGSVREINYLKFFRISDYYFCPTISLHMILGGLESCSMFKDVVEVIFYFDIDIYGFIGYLKEIRDEDSYMVYIQGYALGIKGESNPQYK